MGYPPPFKENIRPMKIAVLFCRMLRERTGSKKIKPQLDIGVITAASLHDKDKRWIAFFDTRNNNGAFIMKNGEIKYILVTPSEENDDPNPDHIAEKILNYLDSEGVL